MVEARDQLLDEEGDSGGEWSDPYGSETDEPKDAQHVIVINSKGYRESNQKQIESEVIVTIDEINSFLEVGLDSCI